MRILLHALRFRGPATSLEAEASERDLLTARGDQLHVISLAIVFVYSILFTAANFYFHNHLQAYLTVIPIPLSILYYYFFRKGGVWALASKLANMATLMIILSLLKILDQKGVTGILALFIPLMVGAMITFQGKQRVYAWSCVGVILVLLAFLSLTDIHLPVSEPISETKLLQERVQNFVGASLVTVVQVGFLIWVSNQLQNRLLDKEQEKQRLINQLQLQSQEKRRNEVAIELHENINQVLASAKLNLDQIPLPVEQKEKIQDSAEHIEYALIQIRKLYHTLVTPDLYEFELTDLIRQMTDELFAEEDIQIEFDLKVEKHRIIPNDVKLSLYRIAQEHLQNIRQHASASQLLVKLTDESDKLHFYVHDNGVGFHPQEARLGTGIRSMENRTRLHHGFFELISAPGNGCTIKVELPI